MITFIQKHIGFIVFIMVLLALIAPRILTLPGMEWFDLTDTGEIGDTIGGTTAPFWGFLSIILLYLTLREQQQFNKTQQMVSDYDILIKLRDNISELSNNLVISICSSTGGQSIRHQGSFHIEELRNTIHPENAILKDEFDKLYRNCTEIAALSLLFINVLIRSSLDNDIKRMLSNSVQSYSEQVFRLFYLTKHEYITIIPTLHSIDDDIFKQYQITNKKYLKLFEDACHKLQEALGI